MWRRMTIVIGLTISALVCFLHSRQPQLGVSSVNETRKEIATLAARMPYLSVGSVLYDRPDTFYPIEDEREAHNKTLIAVTERRHSVESLRALLSHLDPNVRTLAAVALFDREDPQFLPTLVHMCDDKEPTIVDYLHRFGLSPMEALERPPVKPQSVGDVARQMVSFYLEQASFHYGIEPDNQPGFAEYWQARKDRSHCVSWFKVQLTRASGGITPLQPEVLDRIAMVRRRIDQLPMPDRAWVLLALHRQSEGEVLISERELVNLCKQLGRDKLLALLRSEPPSDDPDLQPRPNYNPLGVMQYFVLRHAEQLFEPADSETLLADERWERDYLKHGRGVPMLSPWWAIAAAQLDRKHAATILKEAFERFNGEFDADERAQLVAARWDLLGTADQTFVVDWFYTAEITGHGPWPPRKVFLEAVKAQPNGRKLIAALIGDPRLDSLDWSTIQTLVEIVNGWCDKPIVSYEETRDLQHPLDRGMSTAIAKARKKYPRETAVVEQTLRDWCDRLRASVPAWLGDAD